MILKNELQSLYVNSEKAIFFVMRRELKVEGPPFAIYMFTVQDQIV